MRVKVFLVIVSCAFYFTGLVWATAPSSKQVSVVVEQNAEYIGLSSAEIDTFIIDQMRKLRIPGLSTCIVRDGQIIWNGNYGYANFEKDIKVNDSTLFNLGSISKSITGVALMQLYERGLIALNDNINDYLPFKVIHPLFPDSVITFRMLLTHKSGINDDWDVLDSLYGDGDSSRPLGQYLENYLVPGGTYFNANKNFNSWHPGAEWDYCNVAFGLIGYLVEVISGVDFEHYCQQNIFEPLEMRDTSWFLANLDTNSIAMPYTFNGSSYAPYGHYGTANYPSGQLRTSSIQLARFLIAFMQKGQIDGLRILDSTTVELMTSIHCSPQNPFPDWAIDWGITWYTAKVGKRLVWGHGGGNAGVRTEMGYCGEEKTGIVVLSNGEWVELFTIMNELFEFAAATTSIFYPGDDCGASNGYRLTQNYPNPFNPITTITYTLPQNGLVNLSIFNITGQRIETLVNEYQSKGFHSIQWDATCHSTGVYFYRIETEQFNAVKRCLFLK